MLKNNHQFFENRECKYFPCHEEAEHINCLFCYCPLYSQQYCPGQYTYVEFDGQKVKDCSGCVYPHRPENYENIIRILEQKDK